MPLLAFGIAKDFKGGYRIIQKKEAFRVFKMYLNGKFTLNFKLNHKHGKNSRLKCYGRIFNFALTFTRSCCQNRIRERLLTIINYIWWDWKILYLSIWRRCFMTLKATRALKAIVFWTLSSIYWDICRSKLASGQKFDPSTRPKTSRTNYQTHIDLV